MRCFMLLLGLWIAPLHALDEMFGIALRKPISITTEQILVEISQHHLWQLTGNHDNWVSWKAEKTPENFFVTSQNYLVTGSDINDCVNKMLDTSKAIHAVYGKTLTSEYFGATQSNRYESREEPADWSPEFKYVDHMGADLLVRTLCQKVPSGKVMLAVNFYDMKFYQAPISIN